MFCRNGSIITYVGIYILFLIRNYVFFIKLISITILWEDVFFYLSVIIESGVCGEFTSIPYDDDWNVTQLIGGNDKQGDQSR